jgi:hypothetical protein
MRRTKQVLPLFVSLASLCLVGSVMGQSSPQSWAAAIAPLAGARSQAEVCVALLKRYGDSSQIGTGQLAYGKAKSDSDAVIAGLITALATGEAPGALPGLQANVNSSLTALMKFCNSVDSIVTASVPPGEKDLLSALAKIAGIDSLIKAMSDGVAALYNNFRGDNALMRKIIQTQLEAARWPDFAKVEPAL